MTAFQPSLRLPRRLGSRRSLNPSHCALDRKHGLDLIEFAAVEGGLAALVVERVDDHFEFAFAIQIKDRGDLVHVRSNRLIRLRVNLTGDKLRLNFAVDYASQNDDGITSSRGESIGASGNGAAEWSDLSSKK